MINNLITPTHITVDPVALLQEGNFRKGLGLGAERIQKLAATFRDSQQYFKFVNRAGLFGIQRTIRLF